LTEAQKQLVEDSLRGAEVGCAAVLRSGWVLYA
jgi:hypothetical protein